jgi:HPt (histidine-containing phosphotransfer) domain-containing protein
MMGNLLSSFIENHADTVSEIEAYIKGGDKNQAAAITHNLKGVAGVFSAVGLQKAALNFEQAVKNGGEKNSDFTDLFRALKVEFDQVMASAREIIDTMASAPPAVQDQPPSVADMNMGPDIGSNMNTGMGANI